MGNNQTDQRLESELEDFFMAERNTAPALSDILLARIIADAQSQLDTVQPEPAIEETGFFQRLLDGIGGWPSMAGLATASIVGVWIGYVQPPAVEPFAGYLISSDAESYLYDVSPASGIFGVEG